VNKISFIDVQNEKKKKCLSMKSSPNFVNKLPLNLISSYKRIKILC